MDPSRNNQRELRRKKLFDQLCNAKLETLTTWNANQFLEGFYSEGDPVGYVSKVMARNAGLSILQGAMRVQSSAQFFNSQAKSQAALVLAYGSPTTRSQNHQGRRFFEDRVEEIC